MRRTDIAGLTGRCYSAPSYSARLPETFPPSSHLELASFGLRAQLQKHAFGLCGRGARSEPGEDRRGAAKFPGGGGQVLRFMALHVEVSPEEAGAGDLVRMWYGGE